GENDKSRKKGSRLALPRRFEIRHRILSRRRVSAIIRILRHPRRDRSEPAAILRRCTHRRRWLVGVSSQRARCHVGESPTEAKRLRLRSKGGAVARKQDGGALRQHARKECARSIRLQRTVNADVASVHVLYPVAETVDNARRQQGPTKGVRSGGPHRRGISGDMMRTTACQLERPSTPGGRNPAEETLPITVSGKWKRRRQGVGSGQTVLLMG